jgi:hypothetical protein
MQSVISRPNATLWTKSPAEVPVLAYIEVLFLKIISILLEITVEAWPDTIIETLLLIARLSTGMMILVVTLSTLSLLLLLLQRPSLCRCHLTRLSVVAWHYSAAMTDSWFIVTIRITNVYVSTSGAC